MKLFYFLLLIFLSCNSSAQKKSDCFADKGIKKALIQGKLLGDKPYTVSGTMYFNKFGRPTLIEQVERKVEFKYDANNLTHTILHHYEKKENLSKIDTNFVIENDELGRPLKITSKDGRSTEYIYQICDEQTEFYKDDNDELIQSFKSIFKGGVLRETILNLSDEIEGRKTKYFEYKFNDLGYWVERKYQYANGKLIHETRKLEYY